MVLNRNQTFEVCSPLPLPAPLLEFVAFAALPPNFEFSHSPGPFFLRDWRRVRLLWNPAVSSDIVCTVLFTLPTNRSVHPVISWFNADIRRTVGPSFLIYPVVPPLSGLRFLRPFSGRCLPHFFIRSLPAPSAYRPPTSSLSCFLWRDRSLRPSFPFLLLALLAVHFSFFLRIFFWGRGAGDRYFPSHLRWD